MKLYVGTYAKYNNGSLDGDWIDLDKYNSRDDFINACYKLHKEEDDPELMFQDCEIDFDWEEKFYSECSAPSEEYWNIKDKLLLKKGFDEELWSEWLKDTDHEPTVENIEIFEDSLIGKFNSPEDFAEEEAIDSGLISRDSPLSFYIDWRKYWEEEYEMNGYTAIGNHIFRP